MELDQELNIREDFPPPSLEQWKQAVVDSLKGADFGKAMYTKTYEGITLKPIYTKDDIADLPFTESYPGNAPYLRGNDPQRFLSEGWLIAQNHAEADLTALNQQLLEELQLGLNAVNITPSHADDQRGATLDTIEAWHQALDGIDLIAAPLFLQLDVDDYGILDRLEEYCVQRGWDLQALKAGVGFDPSSELARKGWLSLPLEETWQKMLDSVNWALQKAPGVRCVSIDGSVYEAAGANSVQELGFALSTAAGYIQGLIKASLSIDEVAPLFQVKLTLGSNFFMEIAKVRAFRLLWAELIKAFGGNENSQKIWIHGRTASFNKSSYDIYVNLLRTATESFSGVIGGVDSLEIRGFNQLLAEPNEFVRRIARNQHIILREEAFFGKVIDPAGGCYYIESLTNELASQAWKLMQELEGSGGFIRSLLAGKIHDLIAPVAKARIEAVNKRRDIIVGVNMYADPQEPAPRLMPAAVNPDPVKAVSLERGPLPRLRAVAALEKLRSEIVSSEANKKIFLLNLGSLAEYKARAEFATGFFQVGGFDVISAGGFSEVAEAVKAARESGAKAFCLCSTDDNYQQLVPQICSALSNETLILAGYPADKVEDYKQLGIDFFIHLRADALATLTDLAARMEVTK
ncbi:MAG: acyl-CoA mutase large subunit family protein [Candidatus Cloacimonetes bacterium]|nr:acyl-CoA mutase large subunit family protein [Candidatus Cloacimonadota bacterium]